jgi:hypothetical protein
LRFLCRGTYEGGVIRYHGYQPTEHGGPSRHSLGSKANTPAQLNNLPQGYLDGSFATTADHEICVKGERRTKVRSERT